ncbi:decaprenylphospho-beta-D-erythro-pentofuranosid-2-ulose 2-reductase [Rhodococcus sp. X156]|uniref:decaprenylphospho-beta-D-erythro-pentofuranosid- 2-ulose 2-reductase n=1 Tax=Rhodococcus sp. X156 TaxID=2499145 RepID=UPI000FD8B07F|nr:decaprenylphospho-beta-D-erythro-pentofuranosid-2-ulose 2-reductase [Rhodococcus sp. X156]
MIDAVGNPQTLLLLGGTSEIALATAAAYAGRRPLRVILAARPSARRDAAELTLRELGATVESVDFDARATDTHPKAIEQCFVGGDVDVSLVAFGLLGDQEQAWTDVSAAVALAETNYVGAVSVGVLLAERLQAQGHGSIVALSTVAAERPRRSNFVYGSTKAGLDAFYTGLTEALRPAGIHVAVVRPGFVRSRMTEGMDAAPLATTPEAVAQVILDVVRNKKEQAWAPAPLRAVMSTLRHIPRPIFRRLPV